MLWTIVTIVFLLLRATPGDPVDAILGNRAPDTVKEQFRKQIGLDKPLPLQYLSYLGNLLHFDLGKSVYGSRARCLGSNPSVLPSNSRSGSR